MTKYADPHPSLSLGHLRDIKVGPWAKSFPESAWGGSVADVASRRIPMREFSSPLLTLELPTLTHNELIMASWLAERGYKWAPHGKTTMAPQLWSRLLEAGAWGITFATVWQARLAHTFGVRHMLIANPVTDPAGLRWLRSCAEDPDLDVLCWVDSREGVALLREALAGAAQPLGVLVEVGMAGGRTGARGAESALDVLDAARRSPEIDVRGVAAYEGSYAAERDPRSLDAIRVLAGEIGRVIDGVPWLQAPIVSVGGSAFFDVIGEQIAFARPDAHIMVRAGAAQIHDDGFYAQRTPLPHLRSAMAGWARVLSRPEPGLALLDGGRRDFPDDQGLPTAPGLGEVVAMNDQHTHLRLTAEGPRPAVGDLVRLGLSHPCTAFDKWRLIPLIDSADAQEPVVIDVVSTFF